MKIEFTRRFSMAHRLLAEEHSKCAIPHGHNEYITVIFSPIEAVALDAKKNMVAPFASLKKTWHRFIDEAVDHSLQLSIDDPLLRYFQEHEPNRLEQVMVTPGDPTTEVVCMLLSHKCRAFLKAENHPFELHSLSIEETPTNKVTLASDDRVQIDGDFSSWWFHRPDLTINDFPNS